MREHVVKEGLAERSEQAGLGGMPTPAVHDKNMGFAINQAGVGMRSVPEIRPKSWRSACPRPPGRSGITATSRKAGVGMAPERL